VRRQTPCAALLGAGIHPAAPVKRRGNRRYYQHHEVLLVRRIRELLYQEGFTISGARNRLDDGPVKMTEAPEALVPEPPVNRSPVSLRAELASIIEIAAYRLTPFSAVELRCRKAIGDVSFDIIRAVGAWRSLVAHLHGVQGVASSNPAAPTSNTKGSLRAAPE
jgi:DNA-binding transcriptional MerR regulator